LIAPAKGAYKLGPQVCVVHAINGAGREPAVVMRIGERGLRQIDECWALPQGHVLDLLPDFIQQVAYRNLHHQ
jgi:hypothetical protein